MRVLTKGWYFIFSGILQNYNQAVDSEDPNAVYEVGIGAVIEMLHTDLYQINENI